MAKVTSAKELAEAIDFYSQGMNELTERGVKYPGLTDKEFPKELQPEMMRLLTTIKNTEEKVNPTFDKYIADPQVLAAIQRMARTFQGLNAAEESPKTEK